MTNSTSDFMFFSDGGPFVWVLLGIGIFGIIFILERSLHLHRGQIRAKNFLDGIRNNLRSGHYVGALTVCEETPGPVARVVKTILLHRSEGEQRMRIAAEEAALLEIPMLERRSGTIGALAKIAPLVGLAGTVFGLLHAFLHMHAAGHYATADLFSADIAQALAATGLGLVISAILQLGYHFVNGRIRALVYDIEKTGIETIRLLVYELNDTADSRQSDK